MIYHKPQMLNEVYSNKPLDYYLQMAYISYHQGSEPPSFHMHISQE